MQLFSSRPPFLLVMKREVPEDPLAVGDVQDFTNELSGPMFSIDPVISQGQVFILYLKEVSGDSSLREVLPVYDALAFS